MRSISSVIPKTDIELKDFQIKNEPVLGYLPGSQERQDLEAALKSLADVTEDIPIVIGGKEYRTEHVQYQPMVSLGEIKILSEIWHSDIHTDRRSDTRTGFAIIDLRS